jgi:AraC-like DNA-binding protein
LDEKFRFTQLYAGIRLDYLHRLAVKRGWSFKQGQHPMFEFVYCIQGSLDQWIGSQLYRLTPGDAVIIKPQQPHRISEAVEEAEFFVFHFDVEEREILSLFRLLDTGRCRELLRGNPLIVRRVDELLGEFGQWDSDPCTSRTGGLLQRARLLQAQSRILELIGIVAESIASDEHSSSGSVTSSQLAIAEAATYAMEQSIHEPLSVQALAGRLGVHRSYLFDCFKKVYGCSPQEHHNQLRIRESKKLLQDTSLPLAHIAEQLRYSSAAHFSKAFQQAAGTTPGKYRNASKPPEVE